MIMSRFSYVLLFTIISSAIFARPVSGTVTAGTLKLSGVVITDGVNFAATDKSGKFQLEVNDQSDFIYIFTPSGYTAKRTDGISQFYKKVDQNTTSVNFDLIPLVKSDNYVLIAVGDPQTKTVEQYSQFEKSVLPDISETAKMYSKQNTPVVVLYLGDVVWDTMSLFDNHKKGIDKLGIPVYSAIGNHDYERELSGDKLCSRSFTNCFGPTYYGFNLGNNYIIVLDNIIYDTNKKYIEDLDQQQIDWIKGYVKYIPAGANVIISMHAPINKFWVKNYVMSNGHKQLLDLLKGFNLKFITGHIHVNSNVYVIPGVMEHNVASSCGAWWNSYYAPDGTPSGYQVFELDSDKTEWYYKSVNKERDFQMELYQKGSFKEKPDAVVAKIWNWDPNWKVEFFEDGKPSNNIVQFNSTDPSYKNAMIARIKEGKITQAEFERANFLMPRNSYFYFATVPSPNAKNIKAVATDGFGRKYSETINLY